MCIDPTSIIFGLVISIILLVLNVLIIYFRNELGGFGVRLRKRNAKLLRFLGLDGIGLQIVIVGIYWIWRLDKQDPLTSAILFLTVIAIMQYTRETFNLRVATNSLVESSPNKQISP